MNVDIVGWWRIGNESGMVEVDMNLDTHEANNLKQKVEDLANRLNTIETALVICWGFALVSIIVGTIVWFVIS